MGYPTGVEVGWSVVLGGYALCRAVRAAAVAEAVSAATVAVATAAVPKYQVEETRRDSGQLVSCFTRPSAIL